VSVKKLSVVFGGQHYDEVLIMLRGLYFELHFERPA
jgi:hypothetical protein